MLKRHLFVAGAVLAAFFAASGAAEAGFRVCNHSNQRVDVALGYLHGQFGWTSEGWWTIPVGRCKTLMRGDLTNQYYYLYATGSRGAIWQAPSGQKGGHFCIQRDRFVFPNRNYLKGSVLDCAASNLQGKQFFVVDTEGAPNHVHNLSN